MTQNQYAFIRPKQAWQMLAMGRSTFYRYMKDKKDEGFPQIYKHCGMSIVRLSDVMAYQEKICGITKDE